MAETYALPELGEGVEEASVVGILTAEGDDVDKDQSLIEVETDKATVEIPSPAHGRVVEILVREGQTIAIGDDYVRIETAPGEANGKAAEPQPESGAREAAEEEAEEERGQPEPPAKEPPAAEAEEASRVAPAEPADREEREPPAAAPSVRRFAREIGVDVERVSGSGPGGRISIADVKAFARRSRDLRAAELAVTSRTPPEEDVEWRALSRIRRATARNMSASWTSIPHVTLHAEADVTSLEAGIRRHAARVEEAGGKLTITAVLVGVFAAALRAFPNVNARLDESGEQLALRHYVHVGVAVDTEKGLLVPVVRDADTKSVEELAVELRELAEKARERRLAPDEMSGGCATLTNLGAFGISSFTPILVPGQAVILGIGAAHERDGMRRLPLSLSFDHRILDGADAARFLQWITGALADPLLFLLGGR